MVRLDFENLINEKAAEGKKEIHDRTQLKNKIAKEEAELRKKEQELSQQNRSDYLRLKPAKPKQKR